MILEKLPGVFLIVCLTIALLALLYILRPFLTVLVVAAVLTIAFYPIYKRILKLFRGVKVLSSIVTCLLVVIIIILPLTVLIFMLAGEASSTYDVIYQKINSGVFDKYFQWSDGGFFYELKQKISPVINLDDLDVKQNIINVARSLSEYLVAQTTTIIKNVAGLLLDFIFMLVAMFYFFKDGHKLVDKIGSISPLPSVYEAQLFSKIGTMVKAIIFGVFLTAIAQGVLGGIGFAIAGISNPIFWGSVMAFFSLMPIVGTSLIWVPAAIIMAILGNYGSALFIMIWGVILVSMIDNFLAPYLIGNRARTYPLLTFFVVLGAIWTMGFKGIIIGPLVLMILMAFLHIYEAEYGRVLKN